MAIHARARELGRRGEDRAAAYVEEIGWRVVERNWRCRSGELDLVAYDPQTGTLVFIEVKCRSGYGFGHPLEAITSQKAARLRGLAVEWLRANEVQAKRIRIDAVGIVLDGQDEVELTHVRGIDVA